MCITVVIIIITQPTDPAKETQTTLAFKTLPLYLCPRFPATCTCHVWAMTSAECAYTSIWINSSALSSFYTAGPTRLSFGSTRGHVIITNTVFCQDHHGNYSCSLHFCGTAASVFDLILDHSSLFLPDQRDGTLYRFWLLCSGEVLCRPDFSAACVFWVSSYDES